MSRTISGGVTINDTIVHIAKEGLPFGGGGPSGLGHYHGDSGFRAVSKEKSVFTQSHFSGGVMLYPPYTPFTRRFLRVLMRFAGRGLAGRLKAEGRAARGRAPSKT